MNVPTNLKPSEGSKAAGLPWSHYNTAETPEHDLPNDCKAAAHWWYVFGFQVAPMDPATKHTRLKWGPWLDSLQRNGHAVIDHAFRDDDALCAIVDASLFILDADTPEAVAELRIIEQQFDQQPNLVVQTRKGEHHYFRKALGTYAHSAGFNSKTHPTNIDIRTGRSATEGRSVIVLPPTPGKVVEIKEAATAADLVEVGQDFIDAIFRHNGKEAPRPKVPQMAQEIRRSAGESEAAEILSYIPANLGYSDWLNVLFGIHQKYLGSDNGLEIADQWSASGCDYCGREELEYKWRTMNIDGGVNWASVCKLAADYGADLSAIARSYDADGNKIKSFSELVDLASNFDTETPPEALYGILKQSKLLPALEQQRILEAIKKATGLPIGSLKQAAAEIYAASNDTPDQLAMARNIVEQIGPENILSAETHVYRWSGDGVWRILDDRTVKQEVQQRLPELAAEVSASLVSSVTDLLRTAIHKPAHQFNVGNPEVVNCLNGELELASDRWGQVSHRREHFRTTQIPVAYDPEATAPLFAQFLEQIFQGDPDADDKASAVLEMFGYTLMAHCRHERFAILVGAGANGKSVLLAVLEALCGGANVAGVQPSQFSNTFQRAHLHNKLANIVTEVRQGEVIDDASLKGIVSGEATTVEKKFCDPFLMHPFSTCWFGTNHMPHTRDFSDALFRRVLVVQFNQVFKPELGNCDPLLKDKLVAELPGILNMALKAYQRVLIDGFTQPMSCVAARDQWRLEADQVAQFVEDMCRRTPGVEVGASILYSEYRGWARDAGVQRILTMKSFRNRMTLLGFGEHRRKNARMVTGITLVESNDEFLPVEREVTGVTGAPTFRVCKKKNI